MAFLRFGQITDRSPTPLTDVISHYEQAIGISPSVVVPTEKSPITTSSPVAPAQAPAQEQPTVQQAGFMIPILNKPLDIEHTWPILTIIAVGLLLIIKGEKWSVSDRSYNKLRKRR